MSVTESVSDDGELLERVANEIAHPRKRGMIAAYARTGNVSLATKAAGIGRTAHYHWLQEDEDYARAFEEAKEIATDLLEAEAVRRAIEGVLKGVYHNGERVAEELVYSDVLLIFLLKGLRPEKYRERYGIEHTGAGGGPIRLADERKVAEAVHAYLAGVSDASIDADSRPAIPPSD